MRNYFHFGFSVVCEPPNENYKLFIDALEISFNIAIIYSNVICMFLNENVQSVKYFQQMLSCLKFMQLMCDVTHLIPYKYLGM